MTNIQTILTHNGVQYSADVMQIKRTTLGKEDHGLWTTYLDCGGDGIGIGLGGYRLDEWDKVRKGSFGTAYGMDHIMRICQTVGVEKWEDLVGKRIYVLFEGTNGHCGRIAAGLANIDTGKALIFKDHIQEWRDREGGE